MTTKHDRIEQEKTTMRLMVSLYGKHCSKPAASAQELEALAAYAARRLDHCHWGQQKPNCHDCPVHCYAPQQRELMRQVMRWTGPRMLRYAPIEAMRYMIRKIRTPHVK